MKADGQSRSGRCVWGLILLGMALAGPVSQAQVQGAKVREDELLAQGGLIQGLGSHELRLAGILRKSAVNPLDTAFAFLEDHRQKLGLENPRVEFEPQPERTGLLLTGSKYVLLERKIDGIPVWGQRLGFLFDQNNTLIRVNGQFAPTPSADAKRGWTVRLSPAEAAAQALADLRAGPYSAVSNAIPQPPSPVVRRIIDRTPYAKSRITQVGEAILFCVPMADGSLRKAYQVILGVEDPPAAWSYLIDAETGAPLFKADTLMTEGPAVGSGIDLYGSNIVLNTYLDADGKYKLIDATKYMRSHCYTNHEGTSWQGCIEVRDAQHVETYSNNPVVFDPNGDNIFDDNGETDPKKNYRAAVMTARHMSKYYDFLLNFLARNSLDNRGISMIANVHYGNKFSNAAWTPIYKMTCFGDSKTGDWPQCRPGESVAHEETHGVSSFESWLMENYYFFDPGAINESYSDIGAAVAGVGDYDWDYAEDIDGTPMRRYDVPENVKNPQPSDALRKRICPMQYDNGGVHINSGIGNHFFYEFSTHLPAEAPAPDGRLTAYRSVYQSYLYARTAVLTATWRDMAEWLKMATIDVYGPGEIYNAMRAAMSHVHMDSFREEGNDRGVLATDAYGAALAFWFSRSANIPYVSSQFDRPTSSSRLKTVAVNFYDMGYCQYRIWYCPAYSDGSPNTALGQILFDTFQSSAVVTNHPAYYNFVLPNSMAVAEKYHIAVEYVSGFDYGAVCRENPDYTAPEGWLPTPRKERSWYCQGNDYTGYVWQKTKYYWPLYGIYNDPNLLIRVIYEDPPPVVTPPALVSPADGLETNGNTIAFTWNPVNGANRYWMEINSSPSWAINSRLFFDEVAGTSQELANVPLGTNYWRVWAGNLGDWCTNANMRTLLVKGASNQTCALIATAGANGAILPAGTTIVSRGQSQVFTAAPNGGYTTDVWRVDGGTVQNGGLSYTLSNIQTNHAVNVTFKSIGGAGRYHPSDVNTNFTITSNEASAYGTAWKQGATWPTPPNPIDIDYVTQAWYLWKTGEQYHDGGGAEPGCWSSGP